MKEYCLKELGYFTVSECEKIKKVMNNKTYMNFVIKYSNYAGNCKLFVCSDYEETEEEIKNFFLWACLAELSKRAD